MRPRWWCNMDAEPDEAVNMPVSGPAIAASSRPASTSAWRTAQYA